MSTSIPCTTAEEVFDLGDRVRTEFYQRIGFADLLEPADGSLT